MPMTILFSKILYLFSFYFFFFLSLFSFLFLSSLTVSLVKGGCLWGVPPLLRIFQTAISSLPIVRSSPNFQIMKAKSKVNFEIWGIQALSEHVFCVFCPVKVVTVNASFYPIIFFTQTWSIWMLMTILFSKTLSLSFFLLLFLSIYFFLSFFVFSYCVTG